MRTRIFQVDAFADRPFRGNPAAVCPLDRWPEDEVLQAIAEENNLSETAYLVPRDGDFELRWFTPDTEVELCGHATLASAYVVLRYMEGNRDSVRFHSAGGTLDVRRDGDLLRMDFPADPPTPVDPPPELAVGLGREPEEVLAGRDWMAVYPDEDAVRGLEPEMRILRELERRGVIATAPADEGSGADFVSRFFAPKVGVPEDPVTGSAHCALAPYWAGRLEEDELRGRQISRRGGEVACTLRGERVELAGSATLYLEGWIRVPA
jgi:PhzF family phenazine biosynthesis protein